VLFDAVGDFVVTKVGQDPPPRRVRVVSVPDDVSELENRPAAVNGNHEVLDRDCGRTAPARLGVDDQQPPADVLVAVETDEEAPYVVLGRGGG